MPPKTKITKEDIIATGIKIVREKGAQAINARTVAVALQCSTQPIFSNFESIEQLKLSIVEKADELCQDFIRREIEKNEYPPYKASGIGYIRFAKEEKELFKLLYMRDRTAEDIPEENGLFNQMMSFVYENTGLTNDNAKLFHLEIWAVVHGIAAMLATGYLNLDWKLISQMTSDLYQGLKKQYQNKE